MTSNKKSRLGNNPLDNNNPLGWIGRDTISPAKKEKVNKVQKAEEKPKEKRETFIIKVDLSEKIKDFAYWERMKQKDALNFILDEFFKDRNTKKRPQE